MWQFVVTIAAISPVVTPYWFLRDRIGHDRGQREPEQMRFIGLTVSKRPVGFVPGRRQLK